jgi:hypothetical protein
MPEEGGTMSEAREAAASRADSAGDTPLTGESTPEPTTEAPAEASPEEAEPAEEEPVEAEGESSGPPRYSVDEEEAEEPAPTADSRQFIYNGQTLNFTAEEVNQVLHQGMERLQELQSQQQAGQQDAAAPTEAQVQNATTQFSQLAPELQGQLQNMAAELQNMRVEKEITKINSRLDEAFSQHRVFNDNPNLLGLSRKFAMTALHDNPRMTEADAVKMVAKEVGEGLNSVTDKWIADKVTDSTSAEGGTGGSVATPSTVKMGRKDLFNGNLLKSLIAKANKGADWQT